MRRTRMPITEVIVWLQAEQKAEAPTAAEAKTRTAPEAAKIGRPTACEMRDPLLPSCPHRPVAFRLMTIDGCF